jgi:hypothetical protein
MVASRNPVQNSWAIIMATNKLAYSILSIEEDSRRLGFWTSIVVQGKNQNMTRSICAYCPCRSTSTSSTNALQMVGLAKQNIMECPRKQFWIDFKSFLVQCQELNEDVVVMGDWNSKYDEVVTWMKELGLCDLIHEEWHISTTSPPTCKRSTSQQIDAIFAPAHHKC